MFYIPSRAQNWFNSDLVYISSICHHVIDEGFEIDTEGRNKVQVAWEGEEKEILEDQRVSTILEVYPTLFLIVLIGSDISARTLLNGIAIHDNI